MTYDDLQATAKDTAARVGDAAAETGRTAAEHASRLADSAADSTARIKASASDALDKAKEGLAGIREQVPDGAGDAIEAGRRAYARGSERVGRQVASQPIEALLLAGAIGYLVGWAANRS